MRFLVMSCLFSLALAGPYPGFRYDTAISLPQNEARSESNEDRTWYGFNERDGSNYRFGYQYPGRVHSESRDEGGNVRGTIGFVDANGTPNIWKYRSDPRNGFTAEIEYGQTNPLASQPAQVPIEVPAPIEEPTPIFYSIEDESKRAQFFDRFAISPQLKNAVESQHVFAAGSSPFSHTPQFVVHQRQVDEAESVSALAAQFGAIPVAAVHDVQSRPGYASQSSSAPVLNYSDGLYTIEIPEPVV